jgi:hypothetical protein
MFHYRVPAAAHSVMACALQLRRKCQLKDPRFYTAGPATDIARRLYRRRAPLKTRRSCRNRIASVQRAIQDYNYIVGTTVRCME